MISSRIRLFCVGAALAGTLGQPAFAADKELEAWTERVAKRFVAADEPYPCWRGPFGSGAAIDTKEPFVSCPYNARKLWESDVEIPGVHRMDRLKVPGLEPGPGVLDPTPSGGFCSPVVAYRKVYLFYYVPNGDAFFEEASREYTGDSFTIGRRAWYTGADDVLHCFDADTGKTLWKRVFSRAGINHNIYSCWKNGGHFTPCVANGRVFFYGPTARLYCVDAHTGEPLWQSDLGRRHEMSVQASQWWRENPNNLAPNGGWCMGYTPAYADGVVAISDAMEFKGGPRNYGGSHLAGFDADTGQRLWKIPGAMRSLNSPIRWIHEGREYFVSVGPQGVFCVEPRSGKVLWKVEESGISGTPAVAGEYLVGAGGSDVVCLAITPRRATERWRRSGVLPGFGHSVPLVYDGRVYSRHGVLDLRTGLPMVTLNTGPSDEAKTRGGVSSPVGGNGFIFCETIGEKTLYSLPASPQAFVPSLLSLDAGSANSVSFALAYNRVYFRNRWRLMCFDVRKRTCALDVAQTRACIEILFSGGEEDAKCAAAALQDVEPQAQRLVVDALARCRKSSNPLLRELGHAIGQREGATGLDIGMGLDLDTGLDIDTGFGDGLPEL